MPFVFGLVIAALFVVLHPASRVVFLPPLSAQRANRGSARLLIASFVAALFGNLMVLLALASEDVRSDSDQVSFYLAVTMALLCLSVLVFEFTGISFRDDVAARRNAAATVTLCGLISGEGFCLAGSNSGNGPGFEAVIFCATISTIALFLAWILFVAFSGIVERVTVERDVAAGIRGGVFLASAGALLGASVAGNWVSFSDTISDLAHFGWPVVLLLVVSVVSEFLFRNRGVAFSIGYGAIVLLTCHIYALRIWGLS